MRTSDFIDRIVDSPDSRLMVTFGTVAGSALLIGPAVVETLRQLYVLEGNQPGLTVVFGLAGGAAAVYLLNKAKARSSQGPEAGQS
jgi:hypothetical protein